MALLSCPFSLRVASKVTGRPGGPVDFAAAALSYCLLRPPAALNAPSQALANPPWGKEEGGCDLVKPEGEKHDQSMAVSDNS